MNELRLDLEGTVFHLKIEEYTKEKDRNLNAYDDYWCKVSMAATNDCINYSTANNEILMSSEVDYLIRLFNSLLAGETIDNKEIEFVEPDLGFEVFPKDEISEILVDLHINLWSEGALTANYISLCLDESDIKSFVEYLEWIVR